MQSNLEVIITLVSASDITFMERWLNEQGAQYGKHRVRVVIRLNSTGFSHSLTVHLETKP